MNQAKPLTCYFGGKSVRLAKIIAEKLPPHRVYVEPFGGQASVLLTKSPSKVEVYNDLSKGLITLFSVVRDPEQGRELVRRLGLTPYARAEWEACNRCYNSGEWEKITDLVEKARIFYVLLSQSFTGTVKNGGWSFGGIKYASNVAENFYNSFENIYQVAKRLRTVQIENQPAMKVMERWDGPDTCMYLDPPYLPETRKTLSNGYKHEMTNEEHITLLEWCLSTKSKVIISGYPSPLYREMLEEAGWSREDFSAIAASALFSNNGLKGKSASEIKRTECLWFSPNAKPATLWDLQELG